jgi:hypothetical protein
MFGARNRGLESAFITDGKTTLYGELNMKETKQNNRRDFLKTGGAALVAASLPLSLMAQEADKETSGDRNNHGLQPIYLQGCAWNRNLPGVYGQACFAFEARAELGGAGVGTIRDDVHPQVNSQFQIIRAERISGQRYLLQGEIIASQTPQLIGNRVTINAESLGNGRGRASLTIESPDDNLVVIAIIAVLIGLLLPAIQ